MNEVTKNDISMLMLQQRVTRIEKELWPLQQPAPEPVSAPMGDRPAGIGSPSELAKNAAQSLVNFAVSGGWESFTPHRQTQCAEIIQYWLNDAHKATSTDGAFKALHARLCERFGYTHDEKDWRRDLASLEEHIARQQPQAAVAPLVSDVSHYSGAVGQPAEKAQSDGAYDEISKALESAKRYSGYWYAKGYGLDDKDGQQVLFRIANGIDALARLRAATPKPADTIAADATSDDALDRVSVSQNDVLSERLKEAQARVTAGNAKRAIEFILSDETDPAVFDLKQELEICRQELAASISLSDARAKAQEAAEQAVAKERAEVWALWQTGSTSAAEFLTALHARLAPPASAEKGAL